MYGKIKRSIAKFIVMMGMATVVLGMLGLQSPAQASDTMSTTTVTATPTVLTANASFVGTSKKVEACKAYAEKLEQQAPPRDPQALCSGKLWVKIVGKVKTPDCPPGWFGGSATLRIVFKEKLRARAFAKSVASGRVRTWARTKIKDRIKVTGEAQSSCALIPIITPPPVEHDECPYLDGNQPVGYVCSTTPPPPPPAENYAPVMDASVGVCVAPGGTSGVINVTGTNKDNVTRTLIFTAPGKAPVEKTVSAGSTESVSFSGFAPGSYTVKVEVKETGKFVTKTVTIIECDVPEVVYDKPLAEIWAGEHAVDENGTTTVWGRIKCDARLTCLLSRPTDNSNLGEMVSWMQGNVEDGWLRFSGTWRNASTLPSGEHTVTLTSVGTDSKGQQVTVTTTVKVIKIVHPET